MLVIRLWRVTIIPSLLSPIGLLVDHSRTRSVWPNRRAPLGAQVVVFAHFDASGKLGDHTLSYVIALRQAGLSIVFVSNSGRLRPDAMERLQAHCDVILVRDDVGRDFGAWRDAMEQVSLPRIDTRMIVLVNDSVYGPLRPLCDIFERVDFGRADAWGATDSWQRRYHLQSYFLAFSPKIFNSDVWFSFWSKVRPVPSKQWVIRHYEIGLSQALVHADFRLAALWSYVDLVDYVRAGRRPEEIPGSSGRGSEGSVSSGSTHSREWLQTVRIRRAAVRRIPMNPTSELWRQLLAVGFPFIKRELLRENPSHVYDVVDWRTVVNRDLQANIGAIENDLRRVKTGRVP